MTLHDLLAARLADPLRPLNPATATHYQRCVEQYGRHLGRRPTLDDLDALPLIGWARATVAEGRRPTTANARLKQLRALWEWAARERLVPMPPPPRFGVPEERPVPDAWTGDELVALFAAAGRAEGWIGPHRASDWWLGVLWWCWSTGARAGETWRLRVEMLDLERSQASVPASIRKESRVPMRWWLSPAAVEALRRVVARSEGVVFTRCWRHEAGYAGRYRRILQDAGLPVHRRNGLQKLRRTVASRIKIRGGDPAVWLGHAPRSVADEHYVDRWAVQTAQRSVWPTDDLAGSLPPGEDQRRLFVA